MELKTFIAETLVGIQDGVQTAIERTQEGKGAINPCFGGTRNAAQQLVQLIEFDLAVTIADRSDGEGMGHIEVLTARSGKEKKSKEASNASRIQFAIPILPAMHMMSPDEGAESVTQSLRRASKVATGPAALGSGGLTGLAGSAGSHAMPSDSAPEGVSEPGHDL